MSGTQYPIARTSVASGDGRGIKTKLRAHDQVSVVPKGRRKEL